MNLPARTSAVVLLLAGGARSGGPINGDDGDPLSNWNTDALMDNISELFNRAQENIWL